MSEDEVKFIMTSVWSPYSIHYSLYIHTPFYNHLTHSLSYNYYNNTYMGATCKRPQTSQDLYLITEPEIDKIFAKY
jgi:hypothetical protein